MSKAPIVVILDLYYNNIKVYLIFMKLTFCGGARMVTGANYLLESKKGEKFLIDCGLEQGSHYAERQNFKLFPYDPSEITAVFITHSHLDHIGRLPKLIKDGFKGKVFSTPPTKVFAQLILEDSEEILKKEAEREGLDELYTLKDIEKLMACWETVDYHQEIFLGSLVVRFLNSGHILGSSFIEISVEGKNLVFSGDLGNTPPPLIKSLEYLEEGDYCLVESTYGNRIHEPTAALRDLLEDVIEDTIKAGGTLMIPAFAMERTQDLLFHLNELVENKRLPKVPVFVDSPLAIKLSQAYQGFREYFNEETNRFLMIDHTLFNFPGLKKTLTVEESKTINSVPPPKVIIAGSGMSHGGRILHHEFRYLPDPKSTILFIGYQAKGSLGRQILDGAKTVKIFGEEVPVKVQARTISGYSAHADQLQILEWLKPMRFTLKKVFVVQGEEEQSLPLAQKIKDNLAVNAEVPFPAETVML